MLITSSSHLTPAGQPAAISPRAVAPMAMNAVSVIEVCLFLVGLVDGVKHRGLWGCFMAFCSFVKRKLEKLIPKACDKKFLFDQTALFYPLYPSRQITVVASPSSWLGRGFWSLWDQKAKADRKREQNQLPCGRLWMKGAVRPLGTCCCWWGKNARPHRLPLFLQQQVCGKHVFWGRKGDGIRHVFTGVSLCFVVHWNGQQPISSSDFSNLSKIVKQTCDMYENELPLFVVLIFTYFDHWMVSNCPGNDFEEHNPVGAGWCLSGSEPIPGCWML